MFAIAGGVRFSAACRQGSGWGGRKGGTKPSGRLQPKSWIQPRSLPAHTTPISIRTRAQQSLWLQTTPPSLRNFPAELSPPEDWARRCPGGSAGEVQAHSALGPSPPSRQDAHSPCTVTSCRDASPAAQLAGGVLRHGRPAPHVRLDFSAGSQQAVVIAGDHYPRRNTNTETLPRQAGFPVLSDARAPAELGARDRTGNRFEDTSG